MSINCNETEKKEEAWNYDLEIKRGGKVGVKHEEKINKPEKAINNLSEKKRFICYNYAAMNEFEWSELSDFFSFVGYLNSAVNFGLQWKFY